MQQDVVDYMDAGKRIKVLRIQKGYSQEDLASRADLSIPYLSNIENARSKASLSTFLKLANALDVTLNDFFYNSQKHADTALTSIIASILADCNDYEIRVLARSLEGLKQALRDGEEYRERMMPRE